MDAQAKQQLIERVKQANNILVTVSKDPTVDQLSACIGLTLMLNKMQKHATAVFSGQVPSTLEFLQPEKTLETNTDSLQDFIISLDKNKADKLRYKVEDQFVRVFITPYRTSLSEKDLQFSQGDFNVDAVVALGVKDRNQLDAAIIAHGRILHDATVISVNSGAGNAPNLGQINWQDPGASSLSEMVVSVSEAFGSGLIDNQIATALLTGIVAETNRFSNDNTSPKVLTMSAQLMAAGANQQLIAKQLEPPPPLVPAIPAQPPTPEPPQIPPAAAPQAPQAPENPKESAQTPPPQPPKNEPEKKENKTSPEDLARPVNESRNGTLNVAHEGKDGSDEVEVNPNSIDIDEEGNLKVIGETPEESGQEQPPSEKSTTPAKEESKEDRAADKDASKSDTPPGPHALLDSKNQPNNPFTANTQPEWKNAAAETSVDPLSTAAEMKEPPSMTAHVADVAPPNPFTFNPITELSNKKAAEATSESAPAESTEAAPATDQVPPAEANVDSARSAVENALASAPFDPATAGPIEALNAQPMTPPLHEEQATDQTVVSNDVPVEPAPDAAAAPPPAPVTPASDTPSLSLPTEPAAPSGAPQSDSVAPAAPPPVPPPLTFDPNLLNQDNGNSQKK
jgi:hypothetical protein